MTSHGQPADAAENALLDWNGPHGLPAFERIDDACFAAAVEAALAEHEGEIEAIAGQSAAPTIENTLRPLELSGRALSRASAIFFCKAGAHTNDTIRALEREIAPKLARHASAIHMNARLFVRIDTLHDTRDDLGLDAETRRVLEKTHKRFVRAGANLTGDAKARLAAINEELAGLGAIFGQNVLADESGWVLYLEEVDLAGLPGFLIAAMAEAAEARGRPGAHAVTVSRSIVEPFLAHSERRDLRERVLSGFLTRGQNGGETDNSQIVRRTLDLRGEKAKLLGYETFAAYKLEDTMAKTPSAVMLLLEPVWDKARVRAAREEAELRRIAAEEGRNHAIAPWDWRYYAGKLRAERFAFDESALKPYLKLENVMAAAFDVAGRLFGLSFTELSDAPAWHADVRVFAVENADGSRRGLFLADHFNRSSKRSGAWMSALQSAHRLDEGQAPIVYNVMNFARPPKNKPALLSLDEARTLFHEFGHALHGLLSETTWPSISGTAVARDFVELPSQLFEHWFTVPEILEKHARHFETGEPMPKELMEKMLAARNANSAFATVEFSASALADMAFHAEAESISHPIGFEAETMRRLAKPGAIAMRHRAPHFLHVFAGDGYAAGYYSYMWSEVLDADAFRAFEEAGDPFDPEVADKLRRFIYAAGGSRDPEDLYTAFRGRLPTPDAMLEKKDLA